MVEFIACGLSLKLKLRNEDWVWIGTWAIWLQCGLGNLRGLSLNLKLMTDWTDPKVIPSDRHVNLCSGCSISNQGEKWMSDWTDPTWRMSLNLNFWNLTSVVLGIWVCYEVWDWIWNWWMQTEFGPETERIEDWVWIRNWDEFGLSWSNLNINGAGQVFIDGYTTAA